MIEDLPRQVARTKRFTAGEPHDPSIVADGELVAYLRAGELRVFDVAAGASRSVAPADGYLADPRSSRAVVTAGARVSVAELGSGDLWPLPVTDATGACLDPGGTKVAYVRDRALRLIDVDGTNDTVLVEPDGPDVSVGLGEFAAWTAVDGGRGFWWAPDGRRLLAVRVDESPLPVMYLADPTQPDVEPRRCRYAAVGTPGADVTLQLVALDGTVREVRWDRDAFGYLVRVEWRHGDPLVAVQSRDQRRVQLLEVAPETGATAVVREVTDPAWVTVPTGVPARTAAGEVVWVERDEHTDTYRLLLDGTYVTPPGLQVRHVTAADDVVTFVAQDEPTEMHLYAYDGTLHRLSAGRGVHDGWRRAGTTVLDSHTWDGRRLSVNGTTLASEAEAPKLDLRVDLVRAGAREQRTAVFRPSWYEPGAGSLPVLVNPYAGPALQVVLACRSWHYLLSQWFAEHGFAVVTPDGRGTPGRGPLFERAVHGDILRPVLDDQVDALHAVAERDGDLDLDRVAIRGWSFSGYLAAAAVLHRPDTFHAAVAGAPVTDQRMYDARWKERFAGQLADHRAAYRESSLLPYAAQLSRPLMLVHGLLDTNVWSLHTLRLSAALTAAGRPHSTLLLPGQGHRPADEDMVANLPHLELAFLRQALTLG